MIWSWDVLDVGCIVALLWVCSGLSTSYAVANALERRVEISTSVSQASASQKPSLTPTMSRTSGAAHSSLTTGAVTTAASPQASSNPTSDLSSTNTTLATNSSSLYKCHLAYLEWFNGDNGPFCEPVMWQNVWVGREYSLTWDPSIFNGSSNTTVSLKYVTEKSGNGGFAPWSRTVLSGMGSVEVMMEQDWLEGQPRHNLSVWIETSAPDGNRTSLAGPVISLIEPPIPSALPSASHAPEAPAPHNSDKKTSMEVGIPIGLAFVFAFSAGLFLVLRRRRRGYMGSRARGHGAVQLTGDEFRTIRSRGNSFKDEPVQGVELQPRGGHRREESIGDLMGSPPIDNRREGSNAFREEIARQRAGDHRPRR